MSTNTVPIERHVRSRDPETSWNAARIDPESWTNLQKRIVDLLRIYGPMTDNEIFGVYTGIRTAQRVRTARQELTLSGAVRRFDDAGVSATGRRAQRWAVAS